MARFVRFSTLALVAGALALPAGASAADRLPLRAAAASGPLGNARLSDEQTLTRFAKAERYTVVRAKPSSSSRRVGRLRYYTENNHPEIYPALESRKVEHLTWIKVRVPGRPNGRVGWVPRSSLQAFQKVTTSLVVNRSTLRARLYRDGKLIWQSRIGVGKSATPTPRGTYWIRERYHFGRSNPVYGPWAFGTSAYSRLTDWPQGGVIGIHGTNAPGLLPGRVSHGCIRVPNDKIAKLAKLLPTGTPLIIK